jgi:hypothetical protein
MSCLKAIEGSAQIKTFWFAALISWSVTNPARANTSAWTFLVKTKLKLAYLFQTCGITPDPYRILPLLYRSREEFLDFHAALDFGFSLAYLRKVFCLYDLPNILGFGLALLCVGDSKPVLVDPSGLQEAGSWPVEPQVSFRAPHTSGPY